MSPYNRFKTEDETRKEIDQKLVAAGWRGRDNDGDFSSFQDRSLFFAQAYEVLGSETGEEKPEDQGRRGEQRNTEGRS